MIPILVAGAAAIAVADHASTPFDSMFERVGTEMGVDPDLLRAIARHESSFNPRAVSPVNPNGTRDYGLMQLNEQTARALTLDVSRLLEPEYNVRGAVTLLKRVRSELGAQFDAISWVASYNAGTPAIKKHGVFNGAYVSAVVYHWLGYTMARQVKGGTA